MSFRFLSLTALFCAIVIFFTIPLNAQTSGSFAGTVKDPAGAVVSGAQIVVRNTVTGESYNATSDEIGRFRIENLAPGRYTISISHAGFKAAEREIDVTAGRAAALDIKLEIEAPHAE